MAPQTSSKIAIARTMNRLLSAKSTTLRIIYCPASLLFHRGLKNQGVRDHLLSGLNSGGDFLQTARKHVASQHLDSAKLIAPGRRVNPVAIVHVQDGRGRNRGIHFF